MDSTVPASVSLKAAILSTDAAVSEAILAVFPSKSFCSSWKDAGRGTFPMATSLYITNAG